MFNGNGMAIDSQSLTDEMEECGGMRRGWWKGGARINISRSDLTVKARNSAILIRLLIIVFTVFLDR